MTFALIHRYKLPVSVRRRCALLACLMAVYQSYLLSSSAKIEVGSSIFPTSLSSSVAAVVVVIDMKRRPRRRRTAATAPSRSRHGAARLMQ